MTKQTLLRKLKELKKLNAEKHDPIFCTAMATNLLLEYIADPHIKEAFYAVNSASP